MSTDKNIINHNDEYEKDKDTRNRQVSYASLGANVVRGNAIVHKLILTANNVDQHGNNKPITYLTQMNVESKIITAVVILATLVSMVIIQSLATFILCLLIILFTMLVLYINYQFTIKFLKVRVGFFYKTISYDKIQSVELIKNNRIAVALSNKRVLIKYLNKKGKLKHTMISPRDRESFCDELNLRITHKKEM